MRSLENKSMALISAYAILLSLLNLPSSASFAIVKSSITAPKYSRSRLWASSGGFGTKAPPVKTYAPDTSEETSSLISFLNSHNSVGLPGGKKQGTEVGKCLKSGIRSVYATRSLKKGEIICKIPSDMALALSDPNDKSETAPSVAHKGANFLNFYANHAQEKITWRSYLNTLPTLESNFDATPDWYSDDEITALEFPRLIGLATERKRDILEALEASGDHLTLEEVKFAAWIVSSRSFEIAITSEESPVTPKGENVEAKKAQKTVSVLLPYLDLINHSSQNFNSELDIIDPEKDEAWFAIRATRNIKEGKEISISYGKGIYSSVEMLANYGFVPQDNKIDGMMLKKNEEGGIESLDGWSTTLEEDEGALEGGEGITDNLRKVLEFRIKIKKAYK